MPGYGARYWAERTPASRRPTYPAFRGDHRADVVVIGGGLVGATAAYVLAKGGLDVVLLESERIAGGSTALGLGVILPEPDAWFREVEAAAGVRLARAAWQDARRSALDMASLLKRLKARADLTASPLVIAESTGTDAATLRREQAARKAAGLDAPWMTAAAASLATGTATSGAMRLRDGFTYDPVRATIALMKAAAGAGARVFEKSPVKRTRFTRKTADVLTATGSIRARGIYVATGRPGAVFRQLERHVTDRQAFAVVTEPLSAAMRREAGRRDAVVRETEAGGHWLRWLPEDRALFGGAVSAPVGGRQLDKVLVQKTGQLMYELSVRYPAISGLPAHWAWPVPVISTSDGLPWIGAHRNYPFHFFAMAFGWHADGLAWFAAKAALRHFTNDAQRQDQTFGFLR
ncbi:MAG: FAD-binding oxidoreductase [Acidobacteriota bacterium]